jgi:hypothetical protein
MKALLTSNFQSKARCRKRTEGTYRGLNVCSASLSCVVSFARGHATVARDAAQRARLATASLRLL